MNTILLIVFVFGVFITQAFSSPVMVKAVGDERIVVAKTILGEARGESKQAMKAVAAVIKVRAKERNMSYREVCLQRKQFSCWNANDPNRKKLSALLESHPAAEWAWHLACNIDSIDTSLVRNANHYMTSSLWRKGTVSWARGKRPVATVGCHVFLRL